MKTPEIFTDFKQKDKLKVSILVAARNEEQNIEKCLTSLINQSYNKELVEIILLDDFSEDKTVSKAKNFEGIKIIQLSQFLDQTFKEKANKKRAISLGVSQATHATIITVDADCFYHENWLKAMAQAYDKKQAKLMTAPVLFYEGKSFFSKFLELDLISLIGITAASIKEHKPTMVNGANLMYTKQDFINLNAFKDNEDIASGDDIFLMQKISESFPKKIHFLKNKDAICYTSAPKTFKEFVNQRIRWTSKSSRYADFHVKFVLAMNYFFNLFLLLGFLFSFLDYRLFVLIFMVLVVKLVIDAVFFVNVLSFFEKKKLMKSYIYIDLLHIVYISILGILSLIGKYTWKGRKV